MKTILNLMLSFLKDGKASVTDPQPSTTTGNANALQAGFSPATPNVMGPSPKSQPHNTIVVPIKKTSIGPVSGNEIKAALLHAEQLMRTQHRSGPVNEL